MTLPPQHMQDALVKIIIALTPLTPDERAEIIAWAKQTFCLECGYPTPPSGVCHCRADD